MQPGVTESVPLRGTVFKPTSAYLAALEQRKPLSPNVGVGFIPILKCKWIEEPNVGVGFMPILQWFKDYFFHHFNMRKGDLSLENGNKPKACIGRKRFYSSINQIVK